MSDQRIATIGVGEDDLVTGEAVALELPPASIGLRVLANILDRILVGMLGYALFMLVLVVSVNTDAALAQALAIIATVGSVVGYPVAMETLANGRTVGKMAAGLRTVRDDAGPITFRHALTRGLIGVVEVYIFYGVPALIAAVVSTRSKRLGDLAAGTYVVRDRVRAQLPPPVPMPPHLAQWAWHADIARLPDGLAMQVRTFLPAAFTMTPHVREQMGRELLDEVLHYVSPAPPAGNHPEYILAAVIADRRRRDLERLHRDAYLRDRLIPTDPVELAAAPPPGMPFGPAAARPAVAGPGLPPGGPTSWSQTAPVGAAGGLPPGSPWAPATGPAPSTAPAPRPGGYHPVDT